MEKVSATQIIDKLREYAEQKIPVEKEKWIDIALRLDVLRLDEAQLLNKMRQTVAQMKVDKYTKQEGKRSVAAAELEIEATEEYRMMKDQEALVFSIDEYIRLAKKSAETIY